MARALSDKERAGADAGGWDFGELYIIGIYGRGDFWYPIRNTVANTPRPINKVAHLRGPPRITHTEHLRQAPP